MIEGLENKVVLITGGSSGIGRATALAFANVGAKIVVAARRIQEGEETVSMITNTGGEAYFVQVDVSKTTEVEALVGACVDKYGRLDCAFNNAGVEGTQFTPTADYEEQIWDLVMNINLKGTWLCMKHEIPVMLKQGKGVIVNMSSVAGLKGTGVIGAAYHASKHGIIGLTRASALEYIKQGIRINAVCPAVIDTAMGERMFLHDEKLEKWITERYPIGRVGTPEEVASAVLWLCSDASSFTIGHALPLDGGVLA